MNQIDSLFKLCKKIKAEYITVSLPKVSEYQYNPKLLESLDKMVSPFNFSLLNSIDFEKLKQILTNISSENSSVKIRFYPGFNSIETITNKCFSPDDIRNNFLPCRQPWSQMQISAFGDVYPCLSVKMGNVKHQPLKTIWNDKKYCTFRNNLKTIKLHNACLGCCYLKQK